MASPAEKLAYQLKQTENKVKELENIPTPEVIEIIPDTGEEIVEKINALELVPDKQVDFLHIKNFPWHLVNKSGQDLISWGNPVPATSQGLTDGANIAWDASLGAVATVTLAGNRTLSNPTNLKVGTYIFVVTQDGTGTRTLAYGNNFRWAGGTDAVLSTAANSVDIITFYSDGTLMFGSILKAFAV